MPHQAQPQSARRSTIVAVIGPSDAGPAELQAAARAGRLIAEKGWILITGGRGGVMEAASRGAAEAGGLVVGILPGITAEQANPYVRVPIVTGLAEARNAVIALTASALIAIGKGYGTLAEIGFALKLGRPVVSLGSWEVDPTVTPARSPEEAVETVKRQIEGSGG